MSGLILPGLETPRPNRKARLAQKALGRSGQPKPIPNMQPRLRGIPPVSGCGVVGTPAGPAIVVNYADGQQQVCQLNPENAPQFGVALISAAAQFQLLKQMQADQAEAEADGQPVPTSPAAEALLAEAIAAAGGPVGLKGDEGDVEDDDLADGQTMHGFPVQYDDGLPPEPAPNAFDIFGNPCYEPPAEGE